LSPSSGRRRPEQTEPKPQIALLDRSSGRADLSFLLFSCLPVVQIASSNTKNGCHAIRKVQRVMYCRDHLLLPLLLLLLLLLLTVLFVIPSSLFTPSSLPAPHSLPPVSCPTNLNPNPTNRPRLSSNRFLTPSPTTSPPAPLPVSDPDPDPDPDAVDPSLILRRPRSQPLSRMACSVGVRVEGGGEAGGVWASEDSS
jgi:hypothetical protein